MFCFSGSSSALPLPASTASGRPRARYEGIPVDFLAESVTFADPDRRWERIIGIALAAFILQLGLNFLWSVIFFRWHEIGWALAEVLALWAAILFTIITFARVSPLAAWLLVPYLAWVSFASILNAAFWRLNGSHT